MSIDHGDGYKTFDDMTERMIKGKTDWQQVSIVLDMPLEQGAQILFGVGPHGNGEAYFDDFTFEEVNYDVEVTGKTEERGKKKKPANLSFEHGF